MLIGVNILGYLVYAGERMQYLQVGFGAPEHVILKDEHILDALVFHQVGEPFTLYAGHVKDICIGYGLLVKTGVLLKLNTVVAAVSSSGEMKWKVGLKNLIAVSME